MSKKQRIDIEQILTISATEYCRSENTSITDYDFMGIHVEKSTYYSNPRPEKVLAKNVPKGTEAVVGYHFFMNPQADKLYVGGTALIPKKKKGKLKR